MPKQRSARSSAKTVKTFLYPLGMTVLLLGIGLLLYHERHTTAFVDATTHQTPPYTELYFTNPNSLPVTASAGQTLPTDFTIHNLEGRDLTYTYSIDFTTGAGQTIILRRQQVAVARNHTARISGNAVSLPSYSGRAEVSVILEGHPEQIHYWVEVKA